MAISDPPKETSIYSTTPSATTAATTRPVNPLGTGTSLPWNFDGTTFAANPTTSPTLAPSPTPSTSHTVSAGTVAGAVVGVVLGLALIALGVLLVSRRRRRAAGSSKHTTAEQDHPSSNRRVRTADAPIGLKTYDRKGNESRSNISETSIERQGGDDMAGWKQVEARSVV